MRFTATDTGTRYEGDDSDVFGYTWIDGDGTHQLTYRYGTEPEWAKCSGHVILRADGSISGCSNDDGPSACRGVSRFSVEPPVWLPET